MGAAAAQWRRFREMSDPDGPEAVAHQFQVARGFGSARQKSLSSPTPAPPVPWTTPVVSSSTARLGQGAAV